MTSTQSTQLTRTEFLQLLHKHVERPLSANTFINEHNLVCRLVCALQLNYLLLPLPDGSPEEYRLRALCNALIDCVNRLVEDKLGLVSDYGNLIVTARILSSRCTSLLASVSSAMALEDERNAKNTELTEKVKDLESQITTMITRHENQLYDNENFRLQHDQSEEANARLQETIDRLNEQLAEKDLNLNDLYDLLADKEEWINSLECDQFLNSKRNASDDPNKTPPKKSSTSSIASPSSMDYSKVNLNQLLLSSSEEEDNDVEIAGLFSDSDEEKEPEDDGHPEAGNSTTEPGTPENPMDIN